MPRIPTLAVNVNLDLFCCTFPWRERFPGDFSKKRTKVWLGFPVFFWNKWISWSQSVQLYSWEMTPLCVCSVGIAHVDVYEATFPDWRKLAQRTKMANLFFHCNTCEWELERTSIAFIKQHKSFYLYFICFHLLCTSRHPRAILKYKMMPRS